MTDRLRLLPLLLYYAVVVLAGARDGFVGDEARYVAHAQNLTQGFYTTRADLNLWSGPGYPLVLVPGAALDLPWLAWKLLNPVFLLGAVWYFHATLALYVPRRAALGFALLFGLYPPLVKEAFFILTEPFATLLLCGLLYHGCCACGPHRPPTRHLLAAGFFAGWLALTKVFFGYVLTAGLVLALLIGFLGKRQAFRRAAVVYGFGLLLCAPHLLYTHALTGKWFYWGTAGGLSLYWMSTPYPHEYGEWHPPDFRGLAAVRANHGPFFDSIAALSPVERDAALRRQALRNIRAHPVKFAHNWIANVGRMLFGYPFSHRWQTPLTYLLALPNMMLYVAAGLCLYPAWKARARFPPELGPFLLFWAVAFGGGSLLSAYERQGRLLVPILGLYVAFTLTRVLRITLRETDAAAPAGPG